MQNIDIQKLQLEWTDELMETFAGNNSLGVAFFCASGELLFANAAMQSLCNNFSSCSLINPTFEKLISLETNNTLIFNGLLTIGKMNAVNTSIEARVYRKDDKLLITGGVNVAQVLNENKMMHILNQKVSNLQRQLAQEKAALENTMRQLYETQVMLIHSEKMSALGQLVAGVAHEINNPVAFLLSNIHSLNETFSDVRTAFDSHTELIAQLHNAELLQKSNELIEKYDIDFIFSDFADVIKSSNEGLNRIKKIVEDLRKFSRHDEAALKTIDIVANLQSTISIALPELKKHKIQVQLIAPERLYLDCYPSELNQVVLNLIINGAQAISAGNGKIAIEVTDNTSFIEINISDNGSGISQEIQSKIFDPFFTTKPIGTGTGLGLSIAHKIINDLHNGRITFVSEINKGTTFTLHLPKFIK